jgi:hypothetical protein
MNLLKGKIDRVEDIDGEAVIVEIKNRMKRLFNKVPDYEQIQVQTYMQIVNLQVPLYVLQICTYAHCTYYIHTFCTHHICHADC